MGYSYFENQPRLLQNQRRCIRKYNKNRLQNNLSDMVYHQGPFESLLQDLLLQIYTRKSRIINKEKNDSFVSYSYRRLFLLDYSQMYVYSNKNQGPSIILRTTKFSSNNLKKHKKKKKSKYKDFTSRSTTIMYSCS